MKRTVVITVEVCTSEYEGVEDSDKGAIDLVYGMLYGEHELPDPITMECGDECRYTEENLL